MQAKDREIEAKDKAIVELTMALDVSLKIQLILIIYRYLCRKLLMDYWLSNCSKKREMINLIKKRKRRRSTSLKMKK